MTDPNCTEQHLILAQLSKDAGKLTICPSRAQLKFSQIGPCRWSAVPRQGPGALAASLFGGYILYSHGIDVLVRLGSRARALTDWMSDTQKSY